MKAVRFHEYGGAEVLRYEDAPDPEPNRDEVVVGVKSVGINHVDIDMRNGSSRLPLVLPHTLGMEFAGDVETVGENVEEVTVGDRVTSMYQVACRTCSPCIAGRQQFCKRLEMLGIQRPGGYAERVAVPGSAIIKLSENMSYDVAASTQTTFGTAWHSLINRARLRAGETILVSAAGSGVGSAALQIAKWAGARVLTSAGSDEKLERAKELGADITINYQRENLTEVVREVTDGNGVEVVLEHIGGEVFSSSIESLSTDGRIVVAGGHAGEIVPLDLIMLFRNQWSVIGCNRATEAELRHVIDLMGRGVLQPVISECFALEEAAQAQTLMENRQHFGKIIMHP